MLLSDEYWPFRLCVALCRGECKWSTISLKKAGLIHDLIEKLWLGNDLVYELTEIDICCECFSHRRVELPIPPPEPG